jgi:type I restriction enzyme, S subunit
LNAGNYGQLPLGWQTKPLKHAVQLNPEVLPDTTPADEVLHYVDIAALEGGSTDLTPKALVFAEAPSRARRVLRDGDTILSTVRTYLKAVASFPAVESNLIASTGFAVLRPNGVLFPRFAYWAALAEPFIENVVAHSTGVSYPAINPSTLGDLPIVVPPLPQQERIANFLDDKTARIDALIAEKERLQETVGMLRASTISAAVSAEGTAGWRRTRLKFLVRDIIDTEHKTVPFFDDGEYLVARTTNIKSGRLTLDGAKYTNADGFEEWTRRAVPAPGDILFTREAPAGEACLVPHGIPLCLFTRQ